MKNWFSFKNITLGGLFIWISVLIFHFTNLYQEEWARLILLLAALVWLPLAIPIISTQNIVLEQLIRLILLPAAVLLAIALFLSNGYLAGLLTLPWLIITILIAWRGWILLQQTTLRNPGMIAIAAAHFFLLVGGAWTMADRLGWQPLGFDPAIVLLTGIHFHYAGFIFPLLAGLATLHHSSSWLKTSSLLAVLSVPLTAIGITFTQILHNSFLEIIAAITVTLAGYSTAIGYADFIIKKKISGLNRLLWLLLAISLLGSMTLAFLYAIRFWWLQEWLTIPAMRALHGTLNAVVVSGSGLLGWKLFKITHLKITDNQLSTI